MVKILSAADSLVSGINTADDEGRVLLHSADSSWNVVIVELRMCVLNLDHFISFEK